MTLPGKNGRLSASGFTPSLNPTKITTHTHTHTFKVIIQAGKIKGYIIAIK